MKTIDSSLSGCGTPFRPWPFVWLLNGGILQEPGFSEVATEKYGQYAKENQLAIGKVTTPKKEGGLDVFFLQEADYP